MSLVVTASVMPCFPTFADEQTESERYPYTMFAASNTEGAITINANSICINGNIATNGTIATTSPNFNVNGTKIENANEEMLYIQKKLNYSYFSGDNVEMYTDDYTLEEQNININNPMDVNGTLEMTGNINLNSGIKAFEDVSLNGEVKNTNNSVIFSETGDININTSNTNFSGLIYAPYGDIVIDTDNLNLNNVVIIGQTITLDCPSINANYSTYMAELVGTESDIDVELYAMGKYNSEANSIDIEWFSNYSDCSYEIWTSADNTEYTSVATVTDSTEYQYAIIEDFNTKYFKVSLTTNYGEYIESIPFIVTKDENGYTVDFLDSDEDGLPDVFEISLGTNINDVDSDKDGLTDYQEVYITGTNPTVYDSVTEGVSDADADSDDDGLSNIQEIELGTDPQLADTDDDGFSDYDELYVYETNPLNPDTDGDGLEDGDELHIGLDPTNPETFGIPDAEYKVEQTISSNSDVLTEINTSENAYELSVDIKTNGYAEKEVTVSKSGYSYAIENDAMIGLSADISISDTCNPEEIVLKYNIKDAYIDNTLNLYSSLEEFQGIKRLNIFKFDEDKNMLLPIETEFDVENGLLYAEVDELGTYCIMDMEIWLNNLGVEMSEQNQPEENAMYFNLPAILSASENSGSVWTPTYINAPIDLVFILQSSGTSVSNFNIEKQLIQNYSSYVFQNYEDVNVFIITFNKSSSETLCSLYHDIRLKNNSDVSSALNKVNYTYESDYCDRGKAFTTLVNENFLRDNADKFIYKLCNGRTNEYTGNYHFSIINGLVGEYSEIFPSGWHYEDTSYGLNVKKSIENNGNLFITLDDDTLSDLTEHFESKRSASRPVYEIIIPTKWKKIHLDGELSPDNDIDTDGDTLTDWEEVDTERLIWNEDGSFEIPTFDIAELTNHLIRFQSSDYNFLYDELKNNISRYYLPILSDPSEKDSDGDSLLDDLEYYIGTNAFKNDSDGDGLSDGFEVELWYDPLDPNPDGDSYNDKEEYDNGTSPYVYNMTELEKSEAFIRGGILGDFDTADSIEALCGQIAFSFVPFVADGRDYIANVFVNLDTKAGLINLGGFLLDLAPVAGSAADAAKAFPKLSRFIAKYADDAPKVVEAIIQAAKEFPHSDEVLAGVAKVLPAGAIDDVCDSIKNGNRITKKEYEVFEEVCKSSGRSLDDVAECILKRDIKEKVINIAKKYNKKFVDAGDLNCTDCANQIEKFLKRNNCHGRRIQLQTVDEDGIKYMGNIALKNEDIIVSANGKHVAILYDGKIYDNIFPDGIDFDEWKKQFDYLYPNLHPDFSGNYDF